MTLTCVAYRASVLPSGRIQLVLDEARTDPVEERLFIPEIASLMKLSEKSIYRFSTRKRNPLPIVRGKGRPYGLRSRINEWLSDKRTPADDLRLALKIFGSK